MREYLLKPVTAQELGEVLERTRRQIEEKRRERENLSALRSRNRSENAFLREKLLESLFTDEGDPADDDAVMRQMRGLGVNLVAGCYAVLDIAFAAEGAARSACRAALAALAEMNGGAVFVCSGAKGARALVMGDHPEDVEERAYSFANSAMHLPEMEKEENLLICIGDTVEDFHEIRRSMRSARHLRHLQTADGPAPRGIFSPGNRGGAGDSAVVRARLYLEEHFSDPNLMLQNAAEEVHLSQSHLSTIFAQETGMTFTQYLTALRIAKARELLGREAPPPYSPDEGERELLLPAPWDGGVYVHHLEAQSYYASGEYLRAENARVLSESALLAYCKLCRRETLPERTSWKL